MIDPVSLGVGAVILAVGAVAGRLQRPVRSKFTCDCSHSLAYHAAPSGACGAEIKRAKLEGTGESTWVPCACRRYIGPKPSGDDKAA